VKDAETREVHERVESVKGGKDRGLWVGRRVLGISLPRVGTMREPVLAGGGGGDLNHTVCSICIIMDYDKGAKGRRAARPATLPFVLTNKISQ
jgi:hypothetical protein